VLVSSTPQTRDGWLVLDRVIDAPVNQDTLTWNGHRAEQNSETPCARFFAHPSRASWNLTMLAMLKAADLLAYS
jgi:hypothetical protein